MTNLGTRVYVGLDTDSSWCEEASMLVLPRTVVRMTLGTSGVNYHDNVYEVRKCKMKFLDVSKNF